jgi:serine/threonine-protein kinase
MVKDSSSNVVRAELEKVLSSDTFAQSESLKRFLRHIVEAKLSGKADELKELSLGAEVFERGDSYDPRLDPIVRVQATRLRGKLRDYYAAEGAHASVVFDLPRGTYVPEFSERERELSGPSPRPAVGPGRKPMLVATAGLSFVALLVGLWALRSWDGEAPAGSPELSSILVLPFTDMSPQGDHEHWGDGIAEEITTTLAGVRGLNVVPRTTAFRYKGSELDLSGIAAELSIGAVLQGSVRRAGNALRVQVQLLRAADGRQLWSETYDRPTEDAFQVQEEIARSVVRAVARNLDTDGGRDERFVPTAGAYEDYLRGRFEQERNTKASLVRSVASFEAALEKDPDFAPAYAGLVESYVLGVLWGFVSPAETKDSAREAAERALELEGDHPEALSAAAMYYLIYEWDVSRAEAILETASGVPTARGLLLVFRNSLDEALAAVDEVKQNEPLEPTLHQLGASVAFHLGNYEDAIARCRSILDWAPDYPLAWHLLSRAQVELGQLAEADNSLDRFDRKAEGTALALASRSVLRAREGRSAEARELLSRLERLSEARYVPPAFTARARAALGDVDGALDDLERAVAERSFPLVFLRTDPDYETLRSDPRFRALVERIGPP